MEEGGGGVRISPNLCEVIKKFEQKIDQENELSLYKKGGNMYRKMNEN